MTARRSVTIPGSAGVMFGSAADRTGSLDATTISVAMVGPTDGMTTSAWLVSPGGFTDPNAAPPISPRPTATPTMVLCLRSI